MTPYAKAIAIGTITGLLAPVVVIVGIIVAFSGIAVTGGGGGGGGIAGVSVGSAALLLLLLVAVGFSAGFAWTLRRARRPGHG